MAGKQRSMVKKGDGVFVLEDAEAVVIADNSAEGAGRVKDAILLAHL